jgi:hypothetical protein
MQIGRLSPRWFARSVAIASVMIASSACSAPVSKSKNQTQFLCYVKGFQLLGASVTEASVCDAFKVRIDKMLPLKTQSVKSLSSSKDVDWIKVDVRLAKSGSATARVSRKNAAGQHMFPEIAVDVMDKPLGQKEVEMLAAEVAKQISQPTKG